MLHLIPPPLHRLMLRVAHRVRRQFRRITKLRLYGVSLIARDSSGHVMLVRHSYGSGDWSLPGGGCGQNEDPTKAIRREIREELSLDLANLEMLATCEEMVSGAPHTAYIFAAELSGKPVPDGREIIALQFFPYDALPPGLSSLTKDRLAYWFDRARMGAP